jgi:hypothetical protein
MFRRVRSETLSPAMEAAPTDPTRTRRAAHLVFGIDERIASTVFGTLTTMATVAAYGRAFQHSPWKVEELVITTAIVLWIGHVYAHALSESIHQGRPLRAGGVWFVAHRELGILLAAVLPCIALTLGGIGVFSERNSIWLALALGLATLAVEGVRYARIEGFRFTGTLVAVALNVGLGFLVVALKVLVLH